MRTPVRHTRRLTSAAAALAIGLGLVALSGCGAGDSGASSDSAVVAPDAGVDSQAKQEAAGVAGGATADQAAKPADAAAAVTAVTFDRKLARRADISITVADVDAAAAKVRAIAASAKGMVMAEAISSEPDDTTVGGFSTITISVPTAELDGTLDRLAELGKVHSRNASTDDVTAQYVDTESRVKTMQASVDRVRALMSQATKLGDIVVARGRALAPPGRPRGHPEPARRPQGLGGPVAGRGAAEHRRAGARSRPRTTPASSPGSRPAGPPSPARSPCC